MESQRMYRNQRPIVLVLIALTLFSLSACSRYKIANYYFEKATAKHDLGDYEGAIKDWDKVIFLDPQNAVAFGNRACEKSKLGDKKGAIKDFTMAIHLDPDDGKHYFNRAIDKFSLEDFTGAIEDYNKALSADPELGEAYNNRGQVEAKIGDYDAAINDFSKSILLKPDAPMGYSNRGAIRNVLGDSAGAIEDFNKAIELNGEEPNYYYMRGIVKSDSKDYSGALEDFNLTIEKFGKNDDFSKYAFFRIWIIKAKAGKIADGRKEVHAYLQQASGDEWPDNIMKFLAGEIDEKELLSSANSQEAKEDRRRKCEAHFFIGESYLVNGNLEMARNNFKQSLATGASTNSEFHSAKRELENLE